MPGCLRTYQINGRKRKRRTPYRYLNVREHDWYNAHKLADRLRLSLADMIGLLISKNLEELNIWPWTKEDLDTLSHDPAVV